MKKIIKEVEEVTLEIGDTVHKILSFTHDDFNGINGELISINPCIVAYPVLCKEATYRVWNIEELEYGGNNEKT